MDSFPLLSSEEYLLRVGAISSVTFYTSSRAEPTSHAKVQADLQARLTEIAASNPWLQGHLKNVEGGGVVLEVPSHGQPLHVEGFDLPHLSLGNPYHELTTSLDPLAVRCGADLIANPDQPLLRVAWISISPTQGAFYLSLSHVVGDGYTYYRLLRMFSSSVAPSALTPQRRHDLPMFAKGYNDTMDLHRSVSMMWHLASTALLSSAPTMAVHSIDNEWIAAQKKAALPLKVSTNDVITSWYFKLCRADVGFMVANTRDRYPNVDQNMAGNYNTVVGYQPEDYATPSLIRKSLQQVPYRRAVSGEFPRMFRKTTAMITSWASLRDSSPPSIPEWSCLAHYPVAAASYNPPYTNLAVVFRKTPTELGIILRTRGAVGDPTELAKATRPQTCSVAPPSIPLM
ncbi:hypothetical protein DYB32_008584 [Aphanomyces invadans]|uniref:Condensation domain-containing protein n=1 Tax=Aphanomyces invadans TaxID=157072 RepID=A0A3R6YZ01_9STRA|nr:hypothetical protein DYB32_008584 [Aphanomyces invadans]